jgi:uncharacterized protein (TIGR02466 family)
MELACAFAVPIGHAFLTPCDRLNGELEQLFLARETAHFRNPSPFHQEQAEMFESRFDLFTWPDPCIQELRTFVLESIFAAAIAASTDSPGALARLRLNNHTWFHVTRHTGYFVAHNHPLASWSAVYCVKHGNAAPDLSAGGVLRMFDTRAGAGAFQDPAIQGQRKQFAVGNLDLLLQPGQLVVFPSYLYHEVTPYYGTETRITVATNCWFTT